MNKRYRSNYDMYLLLKTFLGTVDPELFLLMPFFSPWRAEFVAKVAELITVINKQEQLILGYAVYKAKCRNTLELAVSDNAAILQVLATATDDPILAEKSHYTESDLSRMPDADFSAAADIIGNLVTANLAQLVDFGLSAATQIIYFEKVDKFNDAKTQPRDEIYTKKEATTAIATLCLQINNILKKMDKPVRTLRRSQPAFYIQYMERRQLIDPQTRMQSAIGTITDINGNPISMANIICTALDINRKSTKKGGFIFKTAPDGVYEVIYTYPGMRKVSQLVTIAEGKRAEIKIVMEPALTIVTP